MKLSTCLHGFFEQYLINLKGVCENTVKAYRDTFVLLLPFAAQYHSIKVDSLNIEHLTSNLILAFLDYLENKRENTSRTRNHRLAALKSLAKMIRLMYPEHGEIAERIINIPQKRAQKPLIGFLYQEEILRLFAKVDLNKKEGFRDYTILHLLYDSGARASEIAHLDLDWFNPQNSALAILGKGNRYRQMGLWPKTTKLLKIYIKQYRKKPNPLHKNRIFINQRGKGFTRHGINRLCQKYLVMAFPQKRIKDINPVHCFRHSRAVNMLSSGASITDIKNRLGHQNIQTTMIYLHLDLSKKREVQKMFNEYTQSILIDAPDIEGFIEGENKEDILAYLDDL